VPGMHRVLHLRINYNATAYTLLQSFKGRTELLNLVSYISKVHIVPDMVRR